MTFDAFNKTIDRLIIVRAALQTKCTLSWNKQEYELNSAALSGLGLKLRTKTNIVKMGRRLKRGAQPIANADLGGLTGNVDLFIVELQSVSKK